MRGIVRIAKNRDENHVILLNENKSFVEQNYHGFHELTHILTVDEPGTTLNCFGNTRPNQNSYIEWLANEGAAEFLMPYKEILYEISVSVIDLAIENRATDYNVFRNVKLPAKVKPAEERRALTDEEQEWIRTTPHRAQTAAMIMMYAGLRKSELIPLQWNDIDLSSKTIKIARFVEFSGNQAKVKNYGKSESSKRIVYIPDVLVDYLKGAEHDGFLVCRTANDKMHSNTSWRRMWESYMSVLNYEHGNFDNTLCDKPTSRFQPGGVPFVIEPFTAHCLRHTFITLMYLAGVDIMTAKEQAGHKDISTTLKIYTHLDKTYKAKNIDKFNEHLNAKLRQAT